MLNSEIRVNMDEISLLKAAIWVTAASEDSEN